MQTDVYLELHRCQNLLDGFLKTVLPLVVLLRSLLQQGKSLKSQEKNKGFLQSLKLFRHHPTYLTVRLQEFVALHKVT